MTTKKIVIMIVSVVVALGLLVALFVGGTVLFVFYEVGHNDAANQARTFLKNNERLKKDIGEVKDFGSFVTGSINVQNGSGSALINLKVIGARKTVNATVELMYGNRQQWRVTGASYTNEAGQTVGLLNPYQSMIPATLLVP
jgi:hypothetical protein